MIEPFKQICVEELLKELERNERSLAWAARQLEISAAYLSRVVNGRNNPSAKLTKQIVRLTEKLTKQLSLVS